MPASIVWKATSLTWDQTAWVSLVSSFDQCIATGRNPKTSEKVKIVPKKLAFFKVGKELKDHLDR
ncbi:MAG: HU family DNA-binding protein [Anaerolineales bacterium]